MPVGQEQAPSTTVSFCKLTAIHTKEHRMCTRQVRQAPKAATKEGRRRRSGRKKPQEHDQWQAAGPLPSASTGVKLATVKPKGRQKAATKEGRRHRLERKVAQEPHKVSQQAHNQSTNRHQMCKRQDRRAPKAATKAGRRRRSGRRKPQEHDQ